MKHLLFLLAFTAVIGCGNFEYKPEISSKMRIIDGLFRNSNDSLNYYRDSVTVDNWGDFKDENFSKYWMWRDSMKYYKGKWDDLYNEKWKDYYK